MDSTAFENFRRDGEYRRKSRKRLILISVSVLLLFIIILGAVLGSRQSSKDDQTPPPPTTTTTTSESITAACSVTRYPNTCYSSMAAADGANATTDPTNLFRLSLTVAIRELQNMSALPELTAGGPALEDCKELILSAVDRLSESLATLPTAPEGPAVDDIRAWLSAALTDQETCLDGLADAPELHAKMAAVMVNATRFTSNSLAIATGIKNTLNQINNFLGNRKLLTSTTTTGDVVTADWVAESHRRVLLQVSARGEANVTVAKDGTGQFRTINGALGQVPEKSEEPFVIYIKAGVYVEIVVIEKKMWNVVMVGDGMYATIVSGSLNKVDGTSTFRSATVAAAGRGFMAMDMGFRNTAGPEKHQAVALRSASDHSIFYRCSFDAYQDTLYAYALRQFYSECDIVGSVDFIFGDAAAVLQNCTIRPRQPLPGQKNVVTAQGRTDPNENTGIAIQGCTISPFGNVTAPTYLGRPWKDYSRTIVMETDIGAMVLPEGWLPWVADVVPPATIYYAEYKNSGLGANLTGRVTWPGYMGSVSSSEAKKFVVDEFLQGAEWISEKGIKFASNV